MHAKIDKENAKKIWIHSQRLDQQTPFGKGSSAVTKAIQHLGYVQIDTINVIERCHHHILYNRIPQYKPNDLKKAQAIDKTIFEYWTHALSYVSATDYKYFISDMKSIQTAPGSWFGAVTPADYKKVKTLLKLGPISIRDIKDDVLIEKQHSWGSAKPSKKALQLGFYKGDFVISERDGMLKKYDLADRHFAWPQKPKATTEKENLKYILNRALRSQGLVSLDSICHLKPKLKKSIEDLIQTEVKKNNLIEVEITDTKKIKHWASPLILEKKLAVNQLTHILSPFDPLIIQRKRLQLFFDYEHFFEAYIPAAKRKYGYFTLPVLSKNKIIALLDLKTDRQQKKVLIKNWVWLEKNKSQENKRLIETELNRFEKFQLS